MAVAVVGAASGLTLLTGGVAQAATTVAHDGATAAETCRYEVTARDGLHVRKERSTESKIVNTLSHGQHVSASCNTVEGWKHVTSPTPAGYAEAKWLKPIAPSGGVGAGGGGTSVTTNPLLAGAGAGVLVLGGGIAIAARRRQVKGVS